MTFRKYLTYLSIHSETNHLAKLNILLTWPKKIHSVMQISEKLFHAWALIFFGQEVCPIVKYK